MHMTELLHHAGTLNAEEIETAKSEIQRHHAKRVEIVEGCEALTLALIEKTEALHRALLEMVEASNREIAAKMEGLKRMLIEDCDVAIAEHEARLRRLNGFDESVNIFDFNKEAAE